MKLFVLLLLLSSTNFSLSKTVEQLCREQEGASEEDALVMREHRVPETRVQKCFFDCVFQQAGYSDGDRFLREGFLARSRPTVERDPDKVKVMHEMADRCDGVQNEDRCELAAEINECLFRK